MEAQGLASVALGHCVLGPGPSFVVPTGQERNSELQAGCTSAVAQVGWRDVGLSVSAAHPSLHQRLEAPTVDHNCAELDSSWCRI